MIIYLLHRSGLHQVKIIISCRSSAIALTIVAFTFASDPPCISVMLTMLCMWNIPLLSVLLHQVSLGWCSVCHFPESCFSHLYVGAYYCFTGCLRLYLLVCVCVRERRAFKKCQIIYYVYREDRLLKHQERKATAILLTLIK